MTKISPTWADNKTLTVINFFGGPGTGKSTTAAELFSQMKKAGMKVELIHEAAKDYVWEQWNHIFREQDYIFAHQHRMIRRLVGHDIDYVILDSSMLLGLFYMAEDFPPSFRTFLRDVYDSYTNVNFYLIRSDELEYVEAGRNQKAEDAVKLDKQIWDYLQAEKIPTNTITAGRGAAGKAFEIIQAWHPPLRIRSL